MVAVVVVGGGVVRWRSDEDDVEGRAERGCR
jgi:hypothetical protein